jgi:hypothetical protein
MGDLWKTILTSDNGLKVVTGRLKGASLITVKPLKRGQLFFYLPAGNVLKVPTFQTIQISRDQHLGDLEVLAYMNHSCCPNVHIDVRQKACFALRDIDAGEELTFFYPSTEWVMARPFVCVCGAEECIRMVAGAHCLSLDVLSRYVINEHIIELAMEHLR